MSASARPPRQDSRMVVFGLPDNPPFLAALGMVAVRHTQLDHMLRLTIKSLTGVKFQEVMDATEYNGSERLRERIGKLARSKLAEGPALIKLQALMRRCKRATEKRNILVHGVVAQEFTKEGNSYSSAVGD